MGPIACLFTSLLFSSHPPLSRKHCFHFSHCKSKTCLPLLTLLSIKPLLPFPRKSLLLNLFNTSCSPARTIPIPFPRGQSPQCYHPLVRPQMSGIWPPIDHLDRTPKSGFTGVSLWGFQCKRHCFILFHTILSKGLDYPDTAVFEPQWGLCVISWMEYPWEQSCAKAPALIIIFFR